MSIEVRFHIVKDEFRLDVEFAVPEQGITAIMGPSGCGKTTLLRSIAGLDRCNNGYLKVAEEVWQDTEHFVPAHRRSLGYVFQEPGLFSHLNVKQNLEFGLRRIKPRPPTQVLAKAVELLGIGDLLPRQVEQLSGGEKQRIAIARALALKPKILLMDEPLAALDAARKQEILPYLESVHSEFNTPVLYVSHSSDEVARLANRILLIEKGVIRAVGSTTDILTRLDLSFAHDTDAAVHLETRVVGIDEKFGLTELEFAGGRLAIPGTRCIAGQSIRIRVAARDVSLSLTRQSDTSILNIVPVVIEEICEYDDAQTTLRLDAGGVSILSRITRKSVAKLGLSIGQSVFAQLKSVALT